MLSVNVINNYINFILDRIMIDKDNQYKNKSRKDEISKLYEVKQRR